MSEKGKEMFQVRRLIGRRVAYGVEARYDVSAIGASQSETTVLNE